MRALAHLHTSQNGYLAQPHTRPLPFQHAQASPPSLIQFNGSYGSSGCRGRCSPSTYAITQPTSSLYRPRIASQRIISRPSERILYSRNQTFVPLSLCNIKRGVGNVLIYHPIYRICGLRARKDLLGTLQMPYPKSSNEQLHGNACHPR